MSANSSWVGVSGTSVASSGQGGGGHVSVAIFTGTQKLVAFEFLWFTKSIEVFLIATSEESRMLVTAGGRKPLIRVNSIVDKTSSTSGCGAASLLQYSSRPTNW